MAGEQSDLQLKPLDEGGEDAVRKVQGHLESIRGKESLTLLYASQVGSVSFNLATKTSDVDYFGIVAQCPLRKLGGDSFESSQAHVPHDIVVYEVEFYLKLLGKGNPSVVQPLFTTHLCAVTSAWESLVHAVAPCVLNRVTYSQYTAFARSKLHTAKEMEEAGLDGPESVAKLGKQLYQALRLKYEGNRIKRGEPPLVWIEGTVRDTLLRVRADPSCRDEAMESLGVSFDESDEPGDLPPSLDLTHPSAWLVAFRRAMSTPHLPRAVKVVDWVADTYLNTIALDKRVGVFILPTDDYHALTETPLAVCLPSGTTSRPSEKGFNLPPPSGCKLYEVGEAVRLSRSSLWLVHLFYHPTKCSEVWEEFRSKRHMLWTRELVMSAAGQGKGMLAAGRVDDAQWIATELQALSKHLADGGIIEEYNAFTPKESLPVDTLPAILNPAQYKDLALPAKVDFHSMTADTVTSLRLGLL